MSIESTRNAAAVWERVIQLDELSPTLAGALLKLRFSDRDAARMQELSTRAKAAN
jgi:hypothetical protein